MVKANKLTQLQVSRMKDPGMYGDGAGLWLKVTDAGSKSWILRYTHLGRERWTGLGPFPEVTLAEARDKAIDWRRKLREGLDPLKVKQEAAIAVRAAAASTVTFDWCAEQYIDAHRAGWKNAKHAAQWTSTLKGYASPIVGTMDVSLIDTDHILRILKPIWQEKTETASRLRGRIEEILGWATVHKYRTGDNPARWKGHLAVLLPARSKVARTKHMAALPWKDMAPFMQSLRARAGIGAIAVQFTILTAARSGEVRDMTWGEVNFDERLWTIPGERMKAKRDHRVPLSSAAFAILQQMKAMALAGVDIVFPGTRSQALSDATLTQVLRRMGHEKITVHGFRSAFRDWAAEATSYPREMAEMALSHAVGNKVEAAYRRGDMLEKRRDMMDDWAMFIG